MKSRSFTTAVVRFLCADSDTDATVALWLLEEPDPDRRVSAYADTLEHDLRELFTFVDESADPSIRLQNEFASIACERVDWETVASMVLRHFAGDGMIAFAPETAKSMETAEA